MRAGFSLHDKKPWRFFELSIGRILAEISLVVRFNHDTERLTPIFGFRYSGGRYYYEALAQGGWSAAIQNIFAFYDNGNGTYSARIQYLIDDYWDGIYHIMFNIAVIQPFGDSFQMLYYTNLTK